MDAGASSETHARIRAGSLIALLSIVDDLIKHHQIFPVTEHHPPYPWLWSALDLIRGPS